MSKILLESSALRDDRVFWTLTYTEEGMRPVVAGGPFPRAFPERRVVYELLGELHQALEWPSSLIPATIPSD